jgi:hypothetical protein
MVFDLGRAMRKKQEFESARLMDFAFRRHARASRLLARSLGVDPAIAASLVATVSEDALPHRLAELVGTSAEEADAAFRTFLSIAHAELVAERGDPTPHRLA